MARIAAIGLGLIGGSLGASLRGAGHYVTGYDDVPERASVAHSRNLIDRPAGDLADCVAGCDVAVLATPISAILSLLPLVDSLAPEGALLLDTGSVKRDVVAVMENLTHAESAIGGHPIAGSEMSGPEAADPRLLSGRPFALCPSSRSSGTAIARAETLVRDAGCVPVQVEAAHHDAVLARTSHLPQIVSSALALSLDARDVELSGPGLRSMTRLAASNPDLWIDILMLNRENLADCMRSFSRRFDELAEMLETGDAEGLRSALMRGRRSADPLTVESPA